MRECHLLCDLGATACAETGTQLPASCGKDFVCLFLLPSLTIAVAYVASALRRVDDLARLTWLTLLAYGHRPLLRMFERKGGIDVCNKVAGR